MRNINNIRRKTICCICVAIVLWALGVAIAFGEAKTKPPADTGPEEWDLHLHEELARDFAAARDQLAEEQYEKRGAEITSWMKETALPSPDNAALLYYQAFLLRPEPNMLTSLQMDKVLKGAEPDRLIRIYLGHCLKMIHVAELASQIPQCTWGIRHPGEHGFSVGLLAAEVRRLAFILAVDARTLAADGHYRAALARCLTIRRFARHVGCETILLYLISRAIDDMAQRTMQHVLGVMPPDADTLTWLRGQLVAVQGTPPSFAKALKADCELILQDMLSTADLLEEIRHHLMENAEVEEAKKKAQNLTDEELLTRAREPYTRFMNSVLRVMDSDMSYEEKYAEIRRLTNKLKEEYGSDPTTGYVIFWSGAAAERIIEWYGLQVRDIAGLNALKAAIELYLIKAKTGQLPDTLPDGLPKDPYSGQDFEYEITKDGFVLRSRVKPIDELKCRQFEFKVQR